VIRPSSATARPRGVGRPTSAPPGSGASTAPRTTGRWTVSPATRSTPTSSPRTGTTCCGSPGHWRPHRPRLRAATHPAGQLRQRVADGIPQAVRVSGVRPLAVLGDPHHREPDPGRTYARGRRRGPLRRRAPSGSVLSRSARSGCCEAAVSRSRGPQRGRRRRSSTACWTPYSGATSPYCPTSSPTRPAELLRGGSHRARRVLPRPGQPGHEPTAPPRRRRPVERPDPAAHRRPSVIRPGGLAPSSPGGWAALVRRRRRHRPSVGRCWRAR